MAGKGNSAKKTNWLKAFIWAVPAGIILLAIVAIMGINFFGPRFVQDYVQKKTGFEFSYDLFKLDILGGSVEIAGLKIDNPKEIGGGNFMTVPELVCRMEPLSLLSGAAHIQELRLHISSLSSVKSPKGNNAQIFAQRLAGAQANIDKTEGARMAAGDTDSTMATMDTSATPRGVRIDHLALQVDKIYLVDATKSTPRTDSFDLNFVFERTNITDMESLKRDMVSEFMTQGVLRGGKNFVRMTKGLAGSVLGVGIDTMDGTLKGALEGFKKILSK